MSDVIRLSNEEAALAARIASATLRASAGAPRGIRFEVMAILLANEVHDIAGITKTGGGQADAEKLMDDMMLWLNERAIELTAEVAMSGVEQTTKQ